MSKPLLLALGGACAVLLMAGAPGCTSNDPPGVHIEFRVRDEAYRPEAIVFNWARPGRVLLSSRLPEVGTLPATGELLGTLFIETAGPLGEPRLLAARGLRSNDRTVVSGGAAVIIQSIEATSRGLVLMGLPLADSNSDGRPDIIAEDCLSVDPGSCLRRPDITGGDPTPPPPDPKGPPAAAPDGGAPPPDAGVAPPPDNGSMIASSLDNGVVGYWRLDEAGGSAAALDSSGKNNHGNLRGLPPVTAWVPGKLGGALDVAMPSGNGVHVPVSTSIDSIRDAFTIAAWTYRQSSRSGYAHIISRRYLGTANEHYGLAFSNGTLRIIVNTYDDAQGLSADVPAPLNSWVHVAATYDGTSLRLYQNGMPVGMIDYEGSIAPDRTPLCLGCGQNTGNDTVAEEALGGRLDEVLLYTRALTAAEITRLAAGEQPRAQ